MDSDVEVCPECLKGLKRRVKKWWHKKQRRKKSGGGGGGGGGGSSGSSKMSSALNWKGGRPHRGGLRGSARHGGLM
jgi:hypothetical protein